MSALALYADVVERWAFVSTGKPAFTAKSGGSLRGRVVTIDDGTHRYQCPARRGRPAVDEAVEIRPFSMVMIAIVDETGPEPRVCLRKYWGRRHQ